MASTNSFLLKINSRDANNKTITNPVQISMLNLGNISIQSIDIKSASIPNVFYNVTSYNNTLRVSFNSGSQIVNIVLPEGQYTMTTLLSALNQAIVSAGGFSLVFTFDSLKNKIYTYSITAYSFIFANSSMFPLIGATPEINYIGTVNVNSYLNFPDLSGPRNIYIKSNLANMNVLEKTGNKNIIGVIPVTVPFANVIHYLNQEDDISVRRSYIYGQSLNDIQIELVDVLGNLLDLDGQNFEIIFKCISNN